MDNDGIADLQRILGAFDDESELRSVNDRFLQDLPPRSAKEAKLYEDLTNCYVLLGQTGVPENLPMSKSLNAYSKWWWEAWEESVNSDETFNFDEELRGFFQEP
jgi:hypothetical protein